MTREWLEACAREHTILLFKDLNGLHFAGRVAIFEESTSTDNNGVHVDYHQALIIDLNGMAQCIAMYPVGTPAKDHVGGDLILVGEYIFNPDTNGELTPAVPKDPDVRPPAS